MELILEQETILRKLRRMAYEIYEQNAGEEKLIFAGILDRGMTVALHLSEMLQKISPLEVSLLQIELDRNNPLNARLTEDIDLTNKVIIVIDDVANSGRTLFYGMKPLLTFLPKKIQTAVLIDRMHKSFPVSVDYMGYSLSTTLQENILVEIEGRNIKGAYLK